MVCNRLQNRLAAVAKVVGVGEQETAVTKPLQPQFELGGDRWSVADSTVPAPFQAQACPNPLPSHTIPQVVADRLSFCSKVVYVLNELKNLQLEPQLFTTQEDGNSALRTSCPAAYRKKGLVCPSFASSAFGMEVGVLEYIPVLPPSGHHGGCGSAGLGHNPPPPPPPPLPATPRGLRPTVSCQRCRPKEPMGSEGAQLSTSTRTTTPST